jgi:hypothetical protein
VTGTTRTLWCMIIECFDVEEMDAIGLRACARRGLAPPHGVPPAPPPGSRLRYLSRKGPRDPGPWISQPARGQACELADAPARRIRVDAAGRYRSWTARSVRCSAPPAAGAHFAPGERYESDGRMASLAGGVEGEHGCGIPPGCSAGPQAQLRRGRRNRVSPRGRLQRGHDSLMVVVSNPAFIRQPARHHAQPVTTGWTGPRRCGIELMRFQSPDPIGDVACIARRQLIGRRLHQNGLPALRPRRRRVVGSHAVSYIWATSADRPRGWRLFSEQGKP